MIRSMRSKKTLQEIFERKFTILAQIKRENNNNKNISKRSGFGKR